MGVAGTRHVSPGGAKLWCRHLVRHSTIILQPKPFARAALLGELLRFDGEFLAFVVETRTMAFTHISRSMCLMHNDLDCTRRV